MERLKGHWQLIALTLIVFALWQTPVVVPLKILVVFLHELSHGLAAVLTGGTVIELSLNPQQGGHAITAGGSRFLILSAGYVGSLGLGMLLLWIAVRTRADRAVMAGCGVVMVAVAALYVREIFPLVFCLASGAAMLASARFLSEGVNDLILRVIGLTSVIYVPYDIVSDTILRASLRSDARMLAEEFGGATVIWGALWLIVSLVAIWFCAKSILGQSSNINFSGQGLLRR